MSTRYIGENPETALFCWATSQAPDEYFTASYAKERLSELGFKIGEFRAHKLLRDWSEVGYLGRFPGNCFVSNSFSS